MSIVWGPSIEETAYAMYVASAAEGFLDGYLKDGKPDVEAIKNLVICINDLKTHAIEEDFESRAEELLEIDWNKAEFDADAKQLRREVE